MLGCLFCLFFLLNFRTDLMVWNICFSLYYVTTNVTPPKSINVTPPKSINVTPPKSTNVTPPKSINANSTTPCNSSLLLGAKS